MAGQELIYSCQVCGQIVSLVHKGGGTLVCCNQAMQPGFTGADTGHQKSAGTVFPIV
ncbi:MAG: desulfoferrodoxin FeS4 iron-binding domain-containing protein [bacterium]